MKGKKYPIGIQTFSKLIEDGYTYVDKTAYLAELIKTGKYYFLSRPRRFGKSLLLSTFHSYFSGERALFQGLAIDRMEMDWEASPVLHFDLNAEDYTREDGLDSILDRILSEYEKEYGLEKGEGSFSGRFQEIIKEAYRKTGRQVVILVDEYDKPLLELEEDSALYIKRQSTLKGLFGNLKTMDKYIRFGFVTGVARFRKVSIFSDLNNLNDISLSEKFADICGLTESELKESFEEGIAELAENRGETYEKTVEALREFYDGYKFHPKGSKLYNPYSVLLALYHQEIEPYWFETGTPTFLARYLKEKGIPARRLNGVKRTREHLISIGLDTDDVVPLMFQTGYLTIVSYDSVTHRMTLGFPNREVEIGFASNLLPLYAPPTQDMYGPYSIYNFQDDLREGRPEEFMERLGTLLKNIPYEMHGESIYQSIVYLVCLLSGTQATPERESYKGRSDLEVETPNYIYIFEFKFNKTVEEAMKQIRERDYAGRHSLDSRTIYLIGANFSENKEERGLTGYVIEEYNN